MRKTMSGKRAGLLVALCLLGMTIAPWAEAQENADATPLRVGLSTRRLAQLSTDRPRRTRGESAMYGTFVLRTDFERI